ncbi:MAG: DUF3011 domain-containing protein [Burkholderiales bacterium]|nr:DUF3011 domain-containing protein [Burkholderiales bacterium]
MRTIVKSLLALASLAALAPAAQAQSGFIECSSISYRYQFCPANTQGRVNMIREVSTGNLCRQGRGWGFDNSGIWVDRGCRAQFSYGRDGGGGGNWNRPGEITCESIGYRRRFCNADTDGRVSLVREISTGNLCRQGRGWGFDNNGIWVDNGCRGVFSYGRDNSSRNDGAAIAAGVLGALALGAAISSSQNSNPPPPPPPPQPPIAVPPQWAIGSFHAYDPDSGDIVQLVVDGGGRVYLRNENGAVVSQGDLRDGMIFWTSGKRSWLAREGPGVMVGDIDTGKHFFFRRNA